MSCPKLLSDSEFKAIQGSELHASMVRNRLVVDITGTNQYSHEHKRARTQILDWLKENSQSLYYVTEDVPVRVYIELDADAVMFKMALHGGDVIPAPPPPPAPKPVPKPKIKPSLPVARPIKSDDWSDLLDAINQKREDYDQFERDRKYKEKEEWIKRKLWSDHEDILKTRFKL